MRLSLPGLAFLLGLAPCVAAGTADVRIGVLAESAPEAVSEAWAPTADYLSQRIPDHRFRVVPLSHGEIPPAIAAGKVDFLLADPSVYAEAEAHHGAEALATLRNRWQDTSSTSFGAVIITRADRTDINALADLRGKSFMGVSASSLGGFLAALRELRAAGLDPYEDFGILHFGRQEAAVMAVREGLIDAATVRTHVIERLARDGRLELTDLRVMTRRSHAGFPLQVSTELYPEWAFAKLAHTADELARRVAAALITLSPESEAARRSESAGWALPADYRVVHALQRELGVGAYQRLVPSASDVLRAYRGWVLLAAALLVVMAALLIYLVRRTRHLRLLEVALRDTLEQRVEERTAELTKALSQREASRHPKALAQSDWHDAFDAITDPIFIHDNEGRIVHANPAYVKRAGADTGTLVGQPYWHVFPRLAEPLVGCREFPRGTGATEEVHLESGEVFVSRSFGMRRADGSVVHAIHILEDVTAERRSEAERRTLSHAVNQAGEGVLVADVSRRVSYANPSVAQLAGVAQDELRGRAFGELFDESSRVRVEAALDQLNQGWSGELTLRDGVPVYVTASAILSEAGHNGYVLTMLDLRAVKHAEQALAQRLAFESALGGVAARFVAAGADSIDSEIARTLQDVAAFVGAESAYVFRDDGHGTLRNTCAWSAPGTSLSSATQSLSLKEFPALASRLAARDDIRVSDLAALPTEATNERAFAQSLGVRSLAIVPLARDERLFGLIGFGTGAARDWAEPDIRMLRAVAEIIANTLQRIEAETKVRRSEESLSQAQRVAHLGNWDWNIVDNTLWWSDEIYRIFGLAPQEFGATYEAFLARVHPDDRQHVIDEVNGALRREHEYSIDHRIVLVDGTQKVVHERAFVHWREDGTPARMVGTVQDVTEARHAERELRRLNRALRTLSRGNETLVRAVDEYQLLRDVCQILVEQGGYRMAWVGYRQHDEQRSVLPVAHAGVEEGYFDTVRFSWGDDAYGQCVSGTAIRTGATCVAHDLGSEQRFLPWREEAVKRGYVSVMALPLNEGGETFGALALYASEPDAFDVAEVNLLTELANDLAFGIAMLRSQRRRKQAEQNLALSEERYRELAESAQDLIYRIQLLPERRFEYVSPSALAITGYTPEEHYADPDLGFKLVHPEDRPLLKAAADGTLEGDGIVTLRWVKKDGTIIWTEQRNTPIYDEQGRLVALDGIARDVTGRKRMEEERARMAVKLQGALEQTIQAIAMTIEKRDPYTAGHQARVAELAVAIGRELGLSEDRLEGIRLGAQIHDIGKIYVPAEFLNRPGMLGMAELEIIRSHPLMGYDIVKGIDFPWPVAAMVVQHHERMDGSGYPHGLGGEDILLESRIIAVADVVEAMASHRPYRPALPLHAALAEIEQFKGVRFDPDAASACLRLFGEGRFAWADLRGAHVPPEENRPRKVAS